MAQFALRWILMFDAVSCAIPGAKRSEQVTDNAKASDLAPLSPEVMKAVESIYREKIARKYINDGNGVLLSGPQCPLAPPGC